MSDPLVSARYMLKHARLRIDEAEGVARGFTQSNPYKPVVEPDADGTNDIHKIKLRIPFPEKLHGIVFDVVNALRAALDHAGYAVAVAANPTKGSNAHFPFGKDKLE